MEYEWLKYLAAPIGVALWAWIGASVPYTRSSRPGDPAHPPPPNAREEFNLFWGKVCRRLRRVRFKR